jgi:hypothetical protein
MTPPPRDDRRSQGGVPEGTRQAQSVEELLRQAANIGEALVILRQDVGALRAEITSLREDNKMQGLALQTAQSAMSDFRVILEKQRQDHSISLAAQEKRSVEELAKVGERALEQIKAIMVKGAAQRFFGWVWTIAGSAALLGLGYAARKFGLGG